MDSPWKSINKSSPSSISIIAHVTGEVSQSPDNVPFRTPPRDYKKARYSDLLLRENSNTAALCRGS